MIGLKIATVAVPYPTGPGPWIRTVLKENNILQGQILLFAGQEIIDLASNANSTCNIATPETVLEGDEMCRADGSIVIYTQIQGINIGKKPEPQPAKPHNRLIGHDNNETL